MAMTSVTVRVDESTKLAASSSAEDWLVIWREDNGLAAYQRTGSHNELFR